jgi:hypothetical protein
VAATAGVVAAIVATVATIARAVVVGVATVRAIGREKLHR